MAVRKVAPARVKIMLAGRRGLPGPDGAEGPEGPQGPPNRLRSAVYAIGDSMTSNGTYPARLQSLLGTASWLVNNRGVGGEDTGTVRDRFIAEVLVPGDAHHVVVLCGVNGLLVADIPGNSFGTTMANVEDRIKDDWQFMASAAKAAGKTVTFITILPFGSYTNADLGLSPGDPGYLAAEWTSAKQAILEACNDFLLNDMVDVDYRIDAYDALKDPANPTKLLPAYLSADGLHPSTAGYNALGDTVHAGATWTPLAGPAVFETTRELTAFDQDLRHDDHVRFRTMDIGDDVSSAAPLSVGSNSRTYPRADLPQVYLRSAVARAFGHLLHSDNGSDFKIAYLLNGVAQAAHFILKRTGLSSILTGLASASDTLAFRASTVQFGEISPGVHVGTAFSLAPISGGFKGTVTKDGGLNQGLLQLDSAGTILSVNTAPTVQVVAGAIAPATNGGADLGVAGSLRFEDAFLVNAPTVTSDGAAKSDPVELPQAFFDAILSVPVMSWQWLDSIERKGDAARWHVGPIAQDVRDALLANGLEPGRLGLFCEDDELAPTRKTRRVVRQAYDEVEVETSSIVVEGGTARMVTTLLKEQRPRVRNLPLLAPDGTRAMVPDPTWVRPKDDPDATAPLVPAFYPEPVLEEIEEDYEELTPTGRKILGLRLDQFHAARAEALRRKIS